MQRDTLLGIPIRRWAAPVVNIKCALGYQSYVSLRHKYVFIETPKAACTTVKHLIYHIEGIPVPGLSATRAMETKRRMYVHNRDSRMPSLLSIGEHEARRILNSPDFFIFCIVRDPFSRLVSAWNNKIRIPEPGYQGVHDGLRPMPSFKAFCEFISKQKRGYLKKCDSHWRLQKYVVFPHAIPYTHIGRLSTFADTARLFLNHLKLDPKRLETAKSILDRKENASQFEHWSDYYDKHTRALVVQLYKDDFDTFGFSERLPPRPSKMDAVGPNAQREFFEFEIRERNEVISDLYAELRRVDQLNREAYRLIEGLSRRDKRKLKRT